VPLEWSLQSVLPRQGFFTKEIRRLLQGGSVFSWLACYTPPVLPVPGHTELQDFRRNA
jgi:hypothetical protein